MLRRIIKGRLSWLLLAGGVILLAKGGGEVYPLLFPPADGPVATSESDSLDSWPQTGEAFSPSREGFSDLEVETPPPAPAKTRSNSPYYPGRFNEGAFLARLEIPRLKADIRVVEGTSYGSLRWGAGHLHGTPMPGLASNSVIAGHRDTHFSVLRNIQVGDRVLIERGTQQFAYKVLETRIVDPHDLSVLRPVNGSMLTLITCYPFWYVGPAPKRFIVRAAAVTANEDGKLAGNR